MKPVLLGKFEPQSEEWVAARSRRIGGSEIAAVVGLAPSSWASAWALWHRKAGLVDYNPSNVGQTWGRILEPVVISHFRANHPEVGRRIRPGAAYAHPERDWQAASPDALFRGTFLEAKTAHSNDAPHWYDGPPVQYYCQVIWTMDTLCLSDGWLAVLIGGSEYREYHFVWDEDTLADIAAMRAAGAAFIESLDAGIAPDIDDSVATYEAMRRVNPLIDRGESVEIERQLAERYLESKSRLDDSEALYRYHRSKLADKMGTAQYATVGGVRFARRQNPSRGDIPIIVATGNQLQEEE